jgi:hypothetical protein
MHGAVLQNTKYIEFANDNTVEVMAMQRFQEGVDAGDRKAATYKAKNAKGEEVEYLVEFPNLTLAELLALNSSPAGQYNDTGGIPYTAFVNPHTLKKMRGFSGGQSAKKVMETVEEMKKELWAEYGPGLKRSDIQKWQSEGDKLLEKMAKGGAAKALAGAKGLKAKADKIGEKMAPRYEAWLAECLAKAGAELDEAEGLIQEGKINPAKKILGPLSRGLKGTDLEERCNELVEQTKAEK